MKKHLSILIGICLVMVCLTFLGIDARAAEIVDSGTSGSYLKWTLDSDGVLTFTGSGCISGPMGFDPVQDFPESKAVHLVVDGSGITIDYNAFSGCNMLRTVTLRKGVTEIGDGTFYECNNLETVILCDDLQKIGDAFYYCKSLSSVTFLGEQPTMGVYCFDGVNATAYYPHGYRYSGWQPRAGKLNWVDIDVFGEYSSNQDATCFADGTKTARCLFCDIPDTVADVGSQLTHDYQPVVDPVQGTTVNVCTLCGTGDPFATGTCGDNLTWSVDAQGLLTITGTGDMWSWAYPNEATPWNAYSTFITAAALSDGVTSIGNDAFRFCSNLESVSIPDGVTSIGDYAFSGCTKLAEIALPEAVSAVGKYAFRLCSSLTSITFNGSVPTFGTDVFADVNAQAFYPCNQEGWEAVAEGYQKLSWAVKHDLETIYREATCTTHAATTTRCARCGLEETVVDESSAFIHQYEATVDEETLEIIYTCAACQDSYTVGGLGGGTCGHELTWLLDTDGVLTISGRGRMTTWFGEYYDEDYEAYRLDMPPWHIFRSSIKRVVIENGVTTISQYAFDNCTNLLQVSIPDSVCSIGKYAFQDCSSLTGITIPDSVISIRSGAFDGCSKLTAITIPNSITSINSGLFYGCSSLSAITIPNSVTSIDSRAFYNCTSLAEITIPNSVTSLGQYAFQKCTSLTHITLPDRLSSIPKYAFMGCSSLTTITLPDSLTKIDEYAFYGCSSLADITLPDRLTSIGSDAFRSCSKLTAITIPNSVTSLGSYAFYGCTRLTSITIPDSVKNIGSNTFYGCTGLTNITLPNNLTNIYGSAFYGCSKLTGITLPNTLMKIYSSAFSGCSSLTEITFLGSAPEISSNAFQNVVANVLYPCNDESWTQSVQGAYGGGLTWKPNHNCPQYSVVEDATCTDDTVIAGLCEMCGETVSTYIPDTATGHSFQQDAVCEKCGGWEVLLDLKDSKGDGWRGHLLQVYEDGILLEAATVTAGSENQVKISVCPGKVYTFQWKKNSSYYIKECSFEIRHNTDVLFSATGSDCELFEGGQNLFGICGHSHEAVISLPNCTEKGRTTYTCALCGLSYANNYVAANGHSFTQYSPSEDATCLHNARESAKCDHCDQINTVTVPFTALGHSYGQDGTCIRCGAAGEIIVDVLTWDDTCWGATVLKVYEDDVLAMTVTFDTDYADSPVGTTSYDGAIPYYRDRKYTFYWSNHSAAYDYQITVGYNGKVLYRGGGYAYDNGELLFTLDESACSHSYEDTITLPTCTREGYTTHTCRLCGIPRRDSYVAATGHSPEDNGICKTCGASGNIIINMNDWGGNGWNGNGLCVYEDGEDVGFTEFYNGESGRYVIPYFNDRVYEFVWYRAGYRGQCSFEILFNDQLVFTAPEHMCGWYSWGYRVYTTACTHSYEKGVCTLCGEEDPDYVPVIVPTLSLSYPTLSFEDEIRYNIYYTLDDASSVTEMGLLIFDEKLEDGAWLDAVDVVIGFVGDGSSYMVQTEGIPAKNLGDAMYFKVYAKLTDGSYVYSDIAGYHAVAYANTVLNNASSSAKAKSLVVAMLNYGAAAQEYFGYKTDALMNAGLTSEQQALVSAYDETMVGNVVQADSAKVGDFVKNGGYSDVYPTVSFGGAFAINYYFTPSLTMDYGMSFYYWNADDYAKADVLTRENATGTLVATQDGTKWGAAVKGIAAKDLDETIYIAAVYSSDGTAYTTGVIAYSLGQYCRTIAAKGEPFGAATAVYGYYAKAYFA